MRLENIIILQNKIDLVSKDDAGTACTDQKFIGGTVAERHDHSDLSSVRIQH